MNILKKINSMRLERGWSVYRLSVEADLPQDAAVAYDARKPLPRVWRDAVRVFPRGRKARTEGRRGGAPVSYPDRTSGGVGSFADAGI